MNPNNIGHKTRLGFIWDFSGSILSQVSTLIVSIVLARILEPEQFGIIGMALVFIHLSQVFVDGGFTDGIIQQKEVSQAEYSSIFYLNLVISLVCAAVFFFLAPLIGRFFKDEQVAEVLQFLVLMLPIIALGKVHAARLVKNINFKALTIRGLVGSIVGGVVGVVAALKGQGVYSLIWQQLVKSGVDTLLLWKASNWVPSLIFSWHKIKKLFSFSSLVFVNNLLTRFFQKVDTLFIGKVFSSEILGFYSRAESLNAQVMTYSSSTLRKVMYPVLSAVHDDDRRFKEIFFKTFSFSTVVSSTLAGVLFFLADKIIILLLGDKWIPSIILFQILIFRVIFGPFNALMSKSILSKGYAKLRLKITFIQRIVMLTPMIFGFYFGIEVFTIAVTSTYLFSFLLHAVVFERYMHTPMKLTLAKYVKPMVPLLGFVILYIFVLDEVNSYVMAALFLVVQFSYLIITRDVGLRLIVNELKMLRSKLTRK